MRRFAFASVFVMVAAAVAAQTPAALTGTWVSVRQPTSTLKIEATPGQVAMTSKAGRFVYVMDGAPHGLATPAGLQTATARWDGRAFVIQTSLASGAVATERWELAAGDTLVATRLVKMRGGKDVPIRRTFRRQP